MTESLQAAPHPVFASKRGRRTEILAAAVASVVNDGYVRTSVSQVARRAGLPRPLVQYYFPTRELMLRAAIGKILEDWRDRYLELPARSAGEPEIGEGIDRLWQHMHEPAYRAYQELQSAARTDSTLRAIIEELDDDAAHRRYDRAATIYATLISADAVAFADARAFTSIFLEGLLHHRFGPAVENSTPDRQLEMLTQFMKHFWLQCGVAPPDKSGDDTAKPADDIRHHAEALIGHLQTLIKTAG